MISCVPRFPSSRSARLPARGGASCFVQVGLALLVLLAAAGPAAAAGAQRPILLLFGDSLTAGYGLAPQDTFPAQLARALHQRGFEVTVRNAGVSGDTTAGGRARLSWSIDEPGIRAAIVELGANDALRGLPPEDAAQNLDAILDSFRDSGIKVLLAGMKAPPNMGSAYFDRFAGIYPRLAEQHGVPLYPFFLDGVASVPALNQDDGMHPNARGVAVIVRGIVPMVVNLLESAGVTPVRAAGRAVSSG
jgi:acyl-CoA thioesterase-1